MIINFASIWTSEKNIYQADRNEDETSENCSSLCVACRAGEPLFQMARCCELSRPCECPGYLRLQGARSFATAEFSTSRRLLGKNDNGNE